MHRSKNRPYSINRRRQEQRACLIVSHPAQTLPPQWIFVDGVRRIEARLIVRRQERFCHGAFGSYAVGAVKVVDLTAVCESPRVGRILWLDRPNVRLVGAGHCDRLPDRERTAGAFQNVGLYAPTRRGGHAPISADG